MPLGPGTGSRAEGRRKRDECLDVSIGLDALQAMKTWEARQPSGGAGTKAFFIAHLS
jgi:hypothetical protein